MKTTYNTFILLLSTVLLSTACTDAFTGPDEPGAPEGMAGTLINVPMADLSLRLDAEQIQSDGSVLHKVTTYIHNEGPDDATGIQLALTASADSEAAGGRGDEIGGDIILVDIVGSTGADSTDDDGVDDIVLLDILGPTAADSTDDGVEDIVLVDLLGAVPVGTSLKVEATYRVSNARYLRFRSEVMRSDLADPDSTPANGDPEEDDDDIILVDLL